MKLLFYFSLISIFGYFAGLWGHRAMPVDSSSSFDSSAPSLSQRGKNRTAVVGSTLKSPDTSEILSEVPTLELYDRLALWLVDASAAEIADFWAEYSTRPDRTDALTKLIFINWTSRDPEAAIAAVAGTEFSRFAWYAWTCHEPDKALAESLARFPGEESKEPLLSVMWALGEFHHAWLRENLGDLPEKWMRGQAMQAYGKWPDSQDPRESIEFLKANGRHVGKKDLISLSREHPIEAYRLALELDLRPNYRSNLSAELVDFILKEDPGALNALVAATRSPETKMKLLIKQFESQIEVNPEAAREELRDMPASWLKEDYLALLGNHYLETDPAQAAELTLEMMQLFAGDRGRSIEVVGSDGSRMSSGEFPNHGSNELREAVLKSEPQTLMEAAVAQSGDDQSLVQEIGHQWSLRDLPAFADWVGAQSQGTQTYQNGARILSHRYKNQAQFSDAMRWTESLASTAPSRENDISNLYYDWLRAQPDQARAWRQSASLDQSTEERLSSADRLFEQFGP